MKAARALVDEGLVKPELLEAAHEAISSVLNVCEYCGGVLLPKKEDFIYCDSSACVGKANECIDPDEVDDGDETGSR